MTILIAHLDVAIYIVLRAQVTLSLLRSQPWTLRFAYRSTPRRLWATPAFVEANRFVTWVWEAAFLVHTLVALFVHGAPRGYVPSVVLLSLGVLTRRLQRGDRIAPGRGHALLAVQDMEPGIPAVELPSLFARFHRGSGVTTEGRGLGLAITHASVRSRVSTTR